MNWYYLSGNPNAISLLEKNQEKINWYLFIEYPSIFEYDNQSMISHFLSTFGEELISSKQ
jgi:hypothetical protein